MEKFFCGARVQIVSVLLAIRTFEQKNVKKCIKKYMFCWVKSLDFWEGGGILLECITSVEYYPLLYEKEKFFITLLEGGFV